MVAIDIDEATRNQILAALDERAARLDNVIHRDQVIKGVLESAGQPVSEDRDRALVWNIAALHETNMARLIVGEAGEPVADPLTLAEAVPWEPAKKAEAFHDWQARR